MQTTSNSDYIHYDGNSTWADTGAGSNVCSIGTTTFIVIAAATYVDCYPRDDFKDLMRCLKEPRELAEFECVETFFPPRYLRAKVGSRRSGLPNGRMAKGRTGRGGG